MKALPAPEIDAMPSMVMDEGMHTPLVERSPLALNEHADLENEEVPKHCGTGLNPILLLMNDRMRANKQRGRKSKIHG